MFLFDAEDIRRYGEERGAKYPLSFWSQLKTCIVSPSLWAIAHHRFGFWVSNIESSYKNPVKLVCKLLYFLGKYLVVCATKVEILSTADIGPGFFLSNKGNIIIGVKSMGTRCSVLHNTTVGQGSSPDELPVFGDRVSIGHDSLVFGSINVGSDVVIGDGTVLSRKVPDGVHLQGHPCKVIKKP